LRFTLALETVSATPDQATSQLIATGRTNARPTLSSLIDPVDAVASAAEFVGWRATPGRHATECGHEVVRFWMHGPDTKSGSGEKTVCYRRSTRRMNEPA